MVIIKIFQFKYGGSDLSLLIHQNHTYISYSNEYMTQQPSHKTLAILTRRQFIHQQVSLIVVRFDISCYTFVPGIILPYHMIGYTLTIIIKSRVGDSGILHDLMVITKDICWALHCSTHNPEFVLDYSEVFGILFSSELIHCKTKLSALV